MEPSCNINTVRMRGSYHAECFMDEKFQAWYWILICIPCHDISASWPACLKCLNNAMNSKFPVIYYLINWNSHPTGKHFKENILYLKVIQRHICDVHTFGHHAIVLQLPPGALCFVPSHAHAITVHFVVMFQHMYPKSCKHHLPCCLGWHPCKN